MKEAAIERAQGEKGLLDTQIGLERRKILKNRTETITGQKRVWDILKFAAAHVLLGLVIGSTAFVMDRLEGFVVG